MQLLIFTLALICTVSCITPPSGDAPEDASTDPTIDSDVASMPDMTDPDASIDRGDTFDGPDMGPTILSTRNESGTLTGATAGLVSLDDEEIVLGSISHNGAGPNPSDWAVWPHFLNAQWTRRGTMGTGLIHSLYIAFNPALVDVQAGTTAFTADLKTTPFAVSDGFVLFGAETEPGDLNQQFVSHDGADFLHDSTGAREVWFQHVRPLRGSFVVHRTKATIAFNSSTAVFEERPSVDSRRTSVFYSYIPRVGQAAVTFPNSWTSCGFRNQILVCERSTQGSEIVLDIQLVEWRGLRTQHRMVAIPDGSLDALVDGDQSADWFSGFQSFLGAAQCDQTFEADQSCFLRIEETGASTYVYRGGTSGVSKIDLQSIAND